MPKSYDFILPLTRAYLSAIKDGSTGIIPSFVVSKNIDLSIATRTIEGLMSNRYFKLDKNAFIHSDQGVHVRQEVA